MQAAEVDFPGIKDFLDAGHQRQPNTVAQLNQVEAQFGLDFTQHLISGSVAPGVPAGGKRDHQTVAATGGGASAGFASLSAGSQHWRRTRAKMNSVIMPYAIDAITSAVGIPIRSDSSVTPKPANGMIPTKLNMNTPDTRPRK